MSKNITPRENEARSIVSTKIKQIELITGDKVKASKFASALVQLSQNKNLSDCKIESVIDVGFQIVQSGLNPNPLFGHAYVVPFKLKGGFTAAQLQVGYKGYIQLGYRAGWKFKATPVYRCDNFDYKFGGFEDEIILEPNYDARNEDNGQWVYENLIGIIVYAKDKEDYIVTEFVPFKKLEQLRVKSQNQQKGKLQYIWLDWAEEMYKAKALKYVVTRLPIEDDAKELIVKEDEIYHLESQKSFQKEPTNINQIPVQNQLELQIEPENSAKKFKNILISKGVPEQKAENFCLENIEMLDIYLANPDNHDKIAQELIGL